MLHLYSDGRIVYRLRFVVVHYKMIHIHSDWFIVYILRLLIFFLSSVLFVFVLCLLSNVASFSGLYVVSSL
jgi:hypothetical protein